MAYKVKPEATLCLTSAVLETFGNHLPTGVQTFSARALNILGGLRSLLEPSQLPSRPALAGSWNQELSPGTPMWNRDILKARPNTRLLNFFKTATVQTKIARVNLASRSSVCDLYLILFASNFLLTSKLQDEVF